MKILHLVSVLIISLTANFSLATEQKAQKLDITIIKPKLLFIAGSTRKESVNKMLAHNALEIAKNLGADTTFIDLKDYPLPIFDEDLELNSGMPKNAQKLKKIFAQHDGIFIAAPEYNGSITPLLKNTLDWISRSNEKNEDSCRVYVNKVIALGSGSPGGLGGQRGLLPLQMMLNNVGAIVLPQKVTIPESYKKFNKEGRLTDANSAQQLEKLVKDFIRITAAIKNSTE